MKVTIFIGGLHGGGAERVVCNLSNYLCEQGHEVDILTMSETDEKYHLLDCVSNTVLLKNTERRNAILNYATRIIRLVRYIKHVKTDCYLVMLPETTILLLSLASLCKQPIVVSERIDPEIYSKKRQKVLKRLSKRATRYVFQTPQIAKWYEETVSQDKYEIIPNAINPEFVRDYEFHKRDKVIVGAGRLTQQKNFGLLIDAFNCIKDRFPDYKLYIFGEGPEKENLEGIITKHKLQDRVVLKGYTNNIKEILCNAQLFVLSSNYEGMPNVLMEAMALGTPCISTICGGGGAEFLIENEVNGILVPRENVTQMAEAISRMLSDEKLQCSIGREAHSIVDRLAPNFIYKQWEQCIKRAINTNVVNS